MKNQVKTKNEIALLGIESSGITCGVGVSINGQLQGEISLSSRNIHSEKLAVFAEFILDSLKTRLEDLSGIVLSAGPGSFTGLRIGYSLAKGLAHSLNIPIVEVATLDVWAYQLGQQSLLIMPVIDAYRDEIFYSIYEWEQGEMKRQSDYSIIKIEDLRQVVKQKTIISGFLSEQLGLKIKDALSDLTIFPKMPHSTISVKALLDLGHKKFEVGEFSDLNSCEPFYMRKFKGVT